MTTLLTVLAVSLPSGTSLLIQAGPLLSKSAVSRHHCTPKFLRSWDGWIQRSSRTSNHGAPKSFRLEALRAARTEVSEDLGRFGGEDTSAYLSALLIFGRLADHMGIGNSKYIPDKPLPFALWISLPLSRRLKNDKPQWKYPRGLPSTPAPLPLTARESFPGLGYHELKIDAGLREALDRSLGGLRVDKEAVGRVFDVFVAEGMRAGVGDGKTLDPKVFETCMLRWASEDPETEGDPVVEWEVFWDHLRGPLGA
ncbi:hypothetical protein AAMO2058_000551900 [Amorphochlora amoebiformis]